MGYTSFEEARNFVRKLSFRKVKEWTEYPKHGNIPEYIPPNPQSSYKGKGWVSMKDWIGLD